MAGRQPKPRRGRQKGPPSIDAEAQEVSAEPQPSTGEHVPELEPATSTEPSGEARSLDAEPERSERRPDDVAEPEPADNGSPEALEPETPAPARPSASRPSTLLRIAAGLGLLALLAAAAIGGWLFGRSAVSPGSAGEERLDAVVERLDRIATDIDAQGGRVEELATAVSNLQSIVEAARSAAESGAGSQQIAELRSAIDELSNRVAQSEQPEQLSELSERIGRIEQALTGLRSDVVTEVQRADTATALGNAYAALADRIAEGAPYAAELEEVASLMPTAPGLDTLRAHAGDGVPTVARLEERLGEIAAELQVVPQPVPADTAEEGFWPTMRQRLEGLVTVRRLDEPNWQAAVADARQALQEGRLAAAVAAIEGAPGSPPPELQEWLEQARARREVEVARERLSAAVLRHVAGQG